MTLAEIIKQAVWSEVAIAIVSDYPFQRKCLEGYKRVFDALQKMEAKGSEFVICVERREDGLDSASTCPDVFGREPNDNDVSYSLVFEPWNSWLGMEVCDEAFNSFSIAQIVAYCLYEMTFFGFSEERRDRERDKLDESVREAKEHPEDLIPLDDLHIEEITMKGYLRCLDRWLRWSNVSREYFGENAKWFKDRFLSDVAPERYDELDRQTLKAALKEIAREIESIADDL